MNVYRVIMKTHQETQYVDENGIIYNSICNFKEGMPTNKKMADLFESRIVCKEEK